MRTAEEILRDIVTDVKEMDMDEGYFGPFFEGNDDDGYVIRWPNLDILVKEAQTALGQHHEKEN